MAQITNNFVKKSGKKSQVDVRLSVSKRWVFVNLWKRGNKHKTLRLSHKEYRKIKRFVEGNRLYEEAKGEAPEHPLIIRNNEVVAEVKDDRPVAVRMAKDLVRRRRVAFHIYHRNGDVQKVTLNDLEE